jgi:hypothetical protein
MLKTLCVLFLSLQCSHFTSYPFNKNTLNVCIFIYLNSFHYFSFIPAVSLQKRCSMTCLIAASALPSQLVASAGEGGVWIASNSCFSSSTSTWGWWGEGAGRTGGGGGWLDWVRINLVLIVPCSFFPKLFKPLLSVLCLTSSTFSPHYISPNIVLHPLGFNFSYWFSFLLQNSPLMHFLSKKQNFKKNIIFTNILDTFPALSLFLTTRGWKGDPLVPYPCMRTWDKRQPIDRVSLSCRLYSPSPPIHRVATGSLTGWVLSYPLCLPMRRWEDMGQRTVLTDGFVTLVSMSWSQFSQNKT